MTQAFADPDELEQFAQRLATFISTMHEEVAQLNQAFGSLEETWQDEKRARFEEQFGLLLQQFASFESDAEDQIPYLQSLAASLRDYLGK